MLNDSKERTPVYMICRPDHHNGDPSQFQVKGMKDILNVEYINKINEKTAN
jgi:wobble nucleotide-excising tRNase